MADSYIALYATTLASAVSSIAVSGIPSGYRDLRVIINGSNTSTSSPIFLTINNDSSANYFEVIARAKADNTTQGYYSNSTVGMENLTIDTGRTLLITDFIDYSANNKHKQYLTRTNSGSTFQTFMASDRWASTSAITSLSFGLAAGTYSVGTTFEIFGILA